VESECELTSFFNYLKVCPAQSVKRNRIFLAQKFNKLVELKANKAPEGTVLYKAWSIFERKWTCTQ
jgi:hypothetical protein